ncbi:unnamed protein product [Linum tenue]|uniref:ADP-ribosyl cyclase/cyclic ADP-ribose hydrolase n=1 Tax=Linum tenue TaxID=586396 RepID=A0AAV0IGG0_9ROSI|nr:unnamed protein product [Linum tenue]
MASFSDSGPTSLPLVSPSPSSAAVRYEVFVSFRGEDTRRGFASHLCDALCGKLGISLVYKDEDKLAGGDSIGPELLKAIEESRVAVVILSRNYASSTWCLEELVRILECRHRKGQRVLPIFYDVDPSDVRKQRGSFGVGLEKHQRDFEQLERWRNALTEVANLSGFTSADYRNDSEMVKDIVEKIWRELSPTFRSISKPLVGMDRRVRAVIKLLGERDRDVRMIGIWGMGGSGKTTVAMAAYDAIRLQFEFSTYLAHVRDVCNSNGGLLHLQRQLFEGTASQPAKDLEGWGSFGAIERLKRAFRGKKMLLVVDDVDHQEQLESLAMEHSSFGLGSRIIVTSRDRHIMDAHGVDSMYETELLDNEEAKVLLCSKALNPEQAMEDFKEVCECVVGYAEGLPLALEVLGSSLRGRSVGEWKSTIEKLKRIPPGKILEVLKISLDGLDEEEKQIFLDILFFCRDWEKQSVVKILESMYLGVNIGIRNLVDKSLVNEGGSKFFISHDLLEEMGKAVVLSECPDEPGKRSRLRGYEEVCHVLTKETGSENVKVMYLRLHDTKRLECGGEAFKNMVNLRLLRLENLQITQGPTYLSHELRVLHWSPYPSKSLPSSFNPHHLIELDLSFSWNLERLWHGHKALPNLIVMNLSHCKNLIETPDFSGTPNLQSLYLKECELLPKIHPSFGNLRKLNFADLKQLVCLKAFPTSLEMSSLKCLQLSGCSKLKKLPDFTGHMECLVELELDGLGIKQLPSTIGSLVGMQTLQIKDCHQLKSIPHSLGCLTSLKEIILQSCPRLEELPISLGSLVGLKELCLWRCDGLRSLPPNLGCLTSLETLTLGSCWKLEHLPPSMGNLLSLELLQIHNCVNLKDLPDSLGCLTSLKQLYLDCCSKLEKLPSSLKGLIALQELSLQFCLRVCSLPELPSQIERIYLNGCISLEEIPDTISLRYGLQMQCFDCLKLDHYPTNRPTDQSDTSALRFMQGHPHPQNQFSIVTPGINVMPDWFNHQSQGSSLTTLKLPDDRHSKNNSDWMGIATSVCFSICYSTNECSDDHICSIGSDLGFLKVSPGVVTEGANHVWLSYIPKDPNKPKQWMLQPNIELSFKGGCSHVKIKRCGYRHVYRHDTTEEECTNNMQGVPLQSEGQPWNDDDTSQRHRVSVLGFRSSKKQQHLMLVPRGKRVNWELALLKSGLLTSLICHRRLQLVPWHEPVVLGANVISFILKLCSNCSRVFTSPIISFPLLALFLVLFGILFVLGKP